MANSILTPQMIAKEMLRVLENNLVFSRNVNRKYEKDFGGEIKKGDTITVRKPAQYTVRTGATAVVQDHVESSVPVTLDSQKGVDVSFSSKELALSLDDFSEQVLQPQLAVLANQVDFDGLQLYKKVANVVGTAGTIPTALKTYLQAGAALDNEACPSDERRGIILSPDAQVEIVDSLKGLFNDSSEISMQYKRGKMGKAGGFDWAMSQNLPVHVAGAYVGTPLVNGATAEGATTLVTDGWTGSVTGLLKQGDVFTIAGVFAVNPLSKQSTGKLRQFVVTADVNSSSGAATIGIFPAINAAGAKQNVTALPADNAALTILSGASGASSQVNLAHHKDAFTLVTAELPLPKNMDMAARASSNQSGLSVRFLRGYDINADKFISRLDILYGWAAIRPEHAVRIQG